MRLVRRKVRKPEPYGKLELERVIGLTTSNAAGLACNPATGEIAYLAGSVVVVYNVLSNNQTSLLTVPRVPKVLSCVAYSPHGGKFICAGESGHQPAVVVWDPATGACVADLKSHKYGIACVEFSPNGKNLVSVGVPQDGYICLWEWRTSTVVIRTRASAVGNPTAALQFSSDGNFFITAGGKHMKHWVVGPHAGRSRTTGAGNLALEGRPIKLGSQKEASFVSISCASSSKDATGNVMSAGELQPFYGLTTTGILCLLHCGLAVEKWVDLKVRQGYAISVSETHVACACSDGIVRFFMKGTLAYSTTLPRPVPLGYHGLTDTAICAALAAGHHPPSDVKFPDAIACSFVNAERLAVIYGDHTLFIWDIENFSKVGRNRVFLAHSSCVWDVATLPMLPHKPLLDQSYTNEGAFATCSADGTIRLWCLDFGSDRDEPDLGPVASLEARPTNVYSKEVLGVLYSDSKSDIRDRPYVTGAEEDSLSQGVRSICVSSDGHHLAAGDKSGNLRIYNLPTLQLISFQEAHDAEILTLSYTKAIDNGCPTDQPSISLLASGGRDRLIHIYDVERYIIVAHDANGTLHRRDYDVIETLDDHSASITTVKFACGGTKLLSCSADKSVVFRSVVKTDHGCRSTRYHQESAPRGTIYDMDIDRMDKLAVTVGQDKKVNILSLASGKPVRSFKPEGDIGEPIKVKLDLSGSYAVCSHSDKHMRLYDFNTGELLAQASGHAEVITGLAFLPNCRRLVSVSGDSCIFVWKLPVNLSRMMRKRCMDDEECEPHRSLKSFLPRFHSKDGIRATKIPKRSKQPTIQIYEGERKEYITEMSPTHADAKKDVTEDAKLVHADGKGGENPAFKFSFSRLPSWAQAKVADEISGNATGQTEGTLFNLSESRWAERLGEGYKLFSESTEDLTPPATIRANGLAARRRFSADGPSLESTPDSTANSGEVTPTSSPQGASRKEIIWKTVHTVFFNELDFLPEGSPVGSCFPFPGVMEPFNNCAEDLEDVSCTDGFPVDKPESLCGVQVKDPTLAEEDVVVYLSDNDEPSSDAVPLGSRLSKDIGDANFLAIDPQDPRLSGGHSKTEEFVGTAEIERLHVQEDSLLQVEKDLPLSTESSLESFKHLSDGTDGGHELNAEGHKSSLEDESVDEEEGGEDDKFVPADDLFSAHFDSLSSDVKVPSSARSSFSARFLARANLSSLRSSIMSPGEWGPPRKIDALLQGAEPPSAVAEEQESQSTTNLHFHQGEGDMQQMQHRLVTLGMAVAESIQDSQGATVTGPREDDKGSDQTDLYSYPNMASNLLSTSPRADPGCVEECVNRNTVSTPPLPMICAPDASDLSVFSFVKKGKDRPSHKPQICRDAEPRDQHGNMDCPSSTQTQDDGVVLVLNEVEPEWIRIGDPTPRASGGQEPPSLEDLGNRRLVRSHEEVGIAEYEASDYTALPEELERKVSLGVADVSTADVLDGQRGSHPEKELDGTSLPRPPSIPDQSSGSASPFALKLPRPKEEYKSALQELLQATEKASRFFSELQTLTGDAMFTTSKSSLEVLAAASTYQEVMPAALEKVQRLAEQAATYNTAADVETDTLGEETKYLVACSETPDDDGSASLQLRSGVASSLSLSDSALASVDIESFVMRYSTRFSETLASQVLALVHKELKSNQP